MKLSERAMLATLRIGCWSGSAHDQEITEEVSLKHRADARDAGRYNKQLVARKFLQPVASKASLARRVHRTLTLPWDDDGTRILSSVGYANYTQQMWLQRLAMEAAVAQFVTGMPNYIKEAKSRLGTMFNADDYPEDHSITKKFYLDVEIKPIPEASDFRAKLSDSSVKAIVKDIEDRTDQRLKDATDDVFKRICDVSSKMAEKLRSYETDTASGSKTVFRDSPVYNIKQLADLLPTLNITNDKRLDALQKQLEDDLITHSPELLRTDAKLRKQTADKADKIFNKVKAFIS